MAYAQYGAGKDKELFGGNYYKTGFTAYTEDYNVEPQWPTEICDLTLEVPIGDITSEIKKAQNCNKVKFGLSDAHLHFFRTITAGTGYIKPTETGPGRGGWKEKTVSGEHDQIVPRTSEDYDNAKELWKGDFAEFLAAHAKTPLYYPSEIPVTPWGWIDDVYQRTKDAEPLIQPHSLVYDIVNTYDVVKDIERRRILFKHIFKPKLAEFTAHIFKTLGASPCLNERKISFAATDPDLEKSCWEVMQETMTWQEHIRLLSQLPVERIDILVREFHAKDSSGLLNKRADKLIHYFNKIVDKSRISGIPSNPSGSTGSLKEKVDFLVKNAVKYSDPKGGEKDEDILKNIMDSFEKGVELTPAELEKIKPTGLEDFDNHLWVIEEMLPYTDWLAAFFDWALEGVPSSLTKTNQRPKDNEWKNIESRRIKFQRWSNQFKGERAPHVEDTGGSESGSDGFAANSLFLFTKLFPQKLMDKGWKLDGTLGDIKVNEHIPDFFEFGNDLARAGSQADQWIWYGIDDNSRYGDLVENHAVSDNIKDIGSFAGKIETFSKVQHELRWVVEPQLDELIFNLRKILHVPCKEFKVGDIVRTHTGVFGTISEISLENTEATIGGKQIALQDIERISDYQDKICWDTSDILYSVPTYLTRFGIPLDKIGEMSSDLKQDNAFSFCEQVVDVEDGLGKRADQGCGYWEYIYYMENALGPSFVNIRGKLHLLKVAAEKIRTLEDNLASGSLRRLASTKTRTASTIVNRIHTQMSELFKDWPKMVEHQWDTSAPLSTRLDKLFDNFEAVTYYFEERSGRLISSEIVANYADLRLKSIIPDGPEKTKSDGDQDLAARIKDNEDLALAKEMAALPTLKEQKEEQETNEREIARDALRWWIRQQNKNLIKY